MDRNTMNQPSVPHGVTVNFTGHSNQGSQVGYLSGHQTNHFGFRPDQVRDRQTNVTSAHETSVPQTLRPKSRNEFEVAIICALRTEFDAIDALLDEYYADFDYGKTRGDPNQYTMGKMGHHHVVLALMPGMGKEHAASLSAYFRTSFPGIQLGLVVGVCAGAPRDSDDRDIILGDIIVSTQIVQIDFGRQLAGKSVRKDTVADNLGRATKEIRGFLGHLQTRRAAMDLRDKTATYLQNLLRIEDFVDWDYPGADHDQLFHPDYRHQHREANECTLCATDPDSCAVALKASCDQLQCSNDKLLIRPRLEKIKTSNNADTRPLLHFGPIASGDSVMRSSQHRDRVIEDEDVIAFEMEGAGVWDNFPTIVIKGVCDYGDSHKSKGWQRYAAATASACLKAILTRWTVGNQAVD